MRRRDLLPLAGLALVVLPLARLASAQPMPPPWTVVPPLREERKPPPPAGQPVWQPGHWQWNGRAYVWVGGRWLAPPPRPAQWVHGHWAHRPDGSWVWVAPHWR